jgi:glycosyltransferase involved in cell wall biosynthesis
MKIAIHKEYGKGSVGGSEYMITVLAEALSRYHDVEVVHHQEGLTTERLAELFGADLERVAMRYVPPLRRHAVRSLNPWRKYRAERSRYAELSRSADLFVSLTHGEEPPPFCQAGAGMLVVLFPLSQRPGLWPYENPRTRWARYAKERLGRAYLEWEWKNRLHSYRVHTAISEYVRRWTLRLWGIDGQLFHPPVDLDFSPAEKEASILCVGRYSPLKKQAEMVSAFRDAECVGRAGWRLVCVGGVGRAAEERLYFKKVNALAAGGAVEVRANLSRREVKACFERAGIFWHAAGYGDDGEADPGRSEHFGIATVEAMAAGCVPVVINKGGQPEIVEHGASGFLWNTLEELRRYTMLLVNDAAMRSHMAAAARIRARAFGRENFIRRFAELAAPIAPTPLMPSL